jgi:hypothetical protein
MVADPTKTATCAVNVKPLISMAPSKAFAGNMHAMAIKADGTLVAWGWNQYGQLGDGTTTDKRVPTQIGTDTDWASVSVGSQHSLLLKNNGSLYACGSNLDGRLGLGVTSGNTTTPTRVGDASDWAFVTAGYAFSMAVKKDGTLYAWGYNSQYQHGDNSNSSKSVPTRIGSASDWLGVVCGNNFTVAFKTDGSLYGSGNNTYGTLGTGDNTVKYNLTTRIGSASDWATVVSGEYHTMAIKTDGSLYTTGQNTNGALGHGGTDDKNVFTRVGTDSDWEFAQRAGQRHSAVVKADGSLWAWGRNDYGQLGIGTNSQENAPKRVGTETGWVSAWCGFDFTLALKVDGSLWAFGRNQSYQLGDNTTVDKNVPIKVGDGFKVP